MWFCGYLTGRVCSEKKTEEYQACDYAYFKKQLESGNITNSFKSQCAKHLLDKSASVQWKLVFKPAEGVEAESKVVRPLQLNLPSSD